ncbi:MAG: ATP-binding protein, partial [Gammaproteobacteria bacterium]|nr:ATP-binding protein [Gammaproteobacteria bacterium]
DTEKSLDLSSESCKWAGGRTLYIGGDFRSLAIVPFTIQDKDRGLLLLKSKQRDYFSTDEKKIGPYEDIARVLGIALTQLRAQVALRERVKELTCLYGIAKVAARPDISLEEILQGTVELLPPGWLYPGVASARIVFGDHAYSTSDFRKDCQTQAAEIVVDGERRGTIEVAYSKEMPELDEGPFLKEERNLINAIAREVALIIENRHKEEDKKHLQEQLRHADRLATLGQLAAGVAHELNEPLVSILGFAQLVGKSPSIPDQVRKDNEKIVAASLHAREVINKLKLFARQAPPHKDRVDLNDIVHDGLYFVESRCAKAGIELVRELESDIPKVVADAGQLYQVLVNLVVNAMQAMPDGGRITIRTARRDTDVALCVEDNGIGMDKGVLKNIFTPFFTTKDVNEGTGLGLAVVHGIVDSHSGSITVDSAVGRGTRFEVLLPTNVPDEPKKQEMGKHAKE